jgi:cytidylate kinase
MKKEAIHDIAKAEDFVRERDQIRRSFLQTFYDVKWEDTTMLNLVLDTSRIPLDMAVKWILEAARALEAKDLNPEDTTQSIEVDDVLARTVAQIMD